MSTEIVRIADAIEVFRFTYQGQPVLTFSQIDTLHVRPEGTSKASFQRNRKRFIENEDFYVLDYKSLDVWRTEFPEAVGANAPSLTLITESGYLMLTKPFGDDLSWQIQRQLVKLYFRVKEVVEQPQPDPTPRLSTEQWNVIERLIREIGACCHASGRARFAANERIRFGYALTQSRDLPPEHFDAVKTDLEGLQQLAEQHQNRMITLDDEFITAVIRPPVSIRKVRAMAKKAVSQPLSF
ncbi:MAG: ORF6N domain-containing protein [Candidatus Competibacter denitrificans]